MSKANTLKNFMASGLVFWSCAAHGQPTEKTASPLHVTPQDQEFSNFSRLQCPDSQRELEESIFASNIYGTFLNLSEEDWKTFRTLPEHIQDSLVAEIYAYQQDIIQRFFIGAPSESLLVLNQGLDDKKIDDSCFVVKQEPMPTEHFLFQTFTILPVRCHTYNSFITNLPEAEFFSNIKDACSRARQRNNAFFINNVSLAVHTYLTRVPPAASFPSLEGP